MDHRLNQMKVHPTVRLQASRASVAARGQRLFDFGVGDPAEPTPLFVREALIASVPEVSEYPTSDGTPELRRAAADYVRRRFDVALDPETEVMPTSGSKEAIFHLPMMLLDAAAGRDFVVYGEPAYEAFRVGTCFAGGRTHEVPLRAEDGYLLAPAAVPAEVLARTAIVFLNYPHNPTGTALPEELFRAWVEARDEHGFTIVSDECYCDLYVDTPPQSILNFGRRGCLVVHSLSKRSGMTGYLTGFLAGDSDLVAYLKRHRHGMGVASPVWIQAAAAVAWQDDEHVAERRRSLDAKRRLLVDGLDARGLRVWPGDVGLFLWVEVPEGTTDVAYAERLLEAGILVAPGSLFGEGQGRYMRLALNPEVEECRAALAAWPEP